MTATAPRTVVSVDFRENRAPRATVALKGRIPRVTRLLALAHRIDRMVRDGEFRDLADAARAMGLTRARVTQITNGRDPISERQLRRIVAEPLWTKQIKMWRSHDRLAALLPDRDGA